MKVCALLRAGCVRFADSAVKLTRRFIDTKQTANATKNEKCHRLRQRIERNEREPHLITAAYATRIFSDRGQLWRHHQVQHGGDANLQSFEAEIDDEDVRAEYEVNRRHILAPTTSTQDNTVYNFPTNDLQGGSNELRRQLDRVFETQVNAFKLNLSFGLILKNSQTNKLRYFIPHNNETLFNASAAVSTRNDLERVMRRIKSIDVHDHLQNSKDNSEWKVQMITNVNYNVTPTNYPLGSPIPLPDFVVNKHCIVPLEKNENTGIPYNDNLCMFRALYYHKFKVIDEDGVQTYFETWKNVKKLTCDKQSFRGVEFSEIPLIEDTFKISINMFELQSLNSAIPRYLSRAKFDDSMTLNIHEGHLSYAKDLAKFISKFTCSICLRHFAKQTTWRNHTAVCRGARAQRFPGKFVKAPTTIFETLEQYDIYVPLDQRKTEYFCTFDFESMLLKRELKLSEKVTVSHEHIPVSWAIKSNVPGFKDTIFYHSRDIDELVESLIKHLQDIAAACEHILLERFDYAFKKLDEKFFSLKEMHKPEKQTVEQTSRHTEAGVESTGFDGESSSEEESDAESECSVDEFIDDSVAMPSVEEYTNPYLEMKTQQTADTNNHSRCHNSMQFVIKKVESTKSELEQYCKRLIVLGFNSESYDLPLIMRTLTQHLNLSSKDAFCVKKGSKYKCIQNDSFKFLDIRNYISATCTYDQFIRAYGSGGVKSFWPYEWFDDFEKLNARSLPPPEAFFSQLKMCNVLGNSEAEINENYADLKAVWVEKKMTSMLDLLKHYNSIDVHFFVGAVENMLQYYFDENVDLFKTTISLPNYARRLVFGSVDAPFPLFDKKDSDLYKIYRASSAGGPSIVFHRYARKDETFIRNNPRKPVKSIIGWDMNNMYGYAIAQEMPTGIYIQYHSESGFRAEPCTRYMDQYFWLDYVAETENITILHKMNNDMKETRIANLFCDGFSMDGDKITVYEYDSNRYHFSCPNCLTVFSDNEKTRKFQMRARERTQSKKIYLESLGIRVVTMPDCYFKKQIKPKIRHIIDRYLPSTFRPGRKFASEAALLRAVKQNKLFGAIYCDVEVPETWENKPESFWHRLSPQEYFAEMSPIFCVSDIYPQDFGEHMSEFCAETNFKPLKRRLLIGGLKAKKIMLSTSLLKWYLSHGMKITKIYRAVEFTPRRCFAKFVEKGTAMRRLGDSCPDKKILAEKYKLQINSLFGSFLRNKEKERTLVFTQSSHSLRLKANDPNFVRCTSLGGENYEVEMIKRRLTLDNPVYLGHTILNKAKELLLDFYYSFLDYYFEREDFMLMCSDTDSAFVCAQFRKL